MSAELTAGFAGVAVFLLIVILFYNRLVRLRFVVRSSWSDIDVHLKKRYELVPGLVAAVKAYAGHERATLERVIELRAAAMHASTPREKSRPEKALTDTLHELFVLVEAYPTLKADARFQDLMIQLRELEDNIEYARRYYNAGVRDYNVATAVFPSSIVASAFAFGPAEFFELSDPQAERRPVPVGLQ
jgi:LemA protein